MKHKVSLIMTLLASVCLLASCGQNEQQAKTSSRASQSSARVKSSQLKKTDLSTIQMIGQWQSTNGMTFSFGNDGKWTYQSTSTSPASGTFQLAGAYQKQLLLKLHGLDQAIGGIGNYLGMKLSDNDQKLYIVGFGEFTPKSKIQNLTQSAKTEMSNVINTTPQTPAQQLVGTWMNTDEDAADRLTTNFDPDGHYQRFSTQTNTVESGTFTAELAQNDPSQLTLTLTTQDGVESQESYEVNSAWTQLTSHKDQSSSIYVKNQMPDSVD